MNLRMSSRQTYFQNHSRLAEILDKNKIRICFNINVFRKINSLGC